MASSAFLGVSYQEPPSYETNHGPDPHKKYRKRWLTGFDFLLVSVGCAIGYGTIWRFPYLAYRGGGIAFLVPYLLAVVMAGIPIFFLEVMMGQFVGGAVVKVWKMVPIFGGLAFPSLVILGLSIAQFNVIQTWTIRYLFASFSWDLPWASCYNYWNTASCTSGMPDPMFYDSNYTVDYQYLNTSANIPSPTDPAAEFWLFLCVFSGIRIAGLLMYFTVPASFVLMIIFAIRGLTLPGAWQGVVYYLYPDLSKLGELRVWASAGTEVFYSYSISLGVLHALGSFNPWPHNVFRDTLLFSTIHTVICILAGFVTFPLMGYAAFVEGKDMNEVVASGFGHVYLAIPKALSLLPIAPLWAVMFFSMLILIGLDTAFISVGAFVAAIFDFFPDNMKKPLWQQAIVAGVTCLVFFLPSLAMVTRGGIYVYMILEYILNYRLFLLVALFECIAVGWIYGSFRFCRNMEVMWKFRMPHFLKIIVAIILNFVTPLFVLIQFIMITVMYGSDPLSFQSYQYPFWVNALGWILVPLSFLAILLVAGYRILTAKNTATLWERIRYPTLPILKSYMVLPEAIPGSYVPDPDEPVAAPESKDLLAGAHDEHL